MKKINMFLIFGLLFVLVLAGCSQSGGAPSQPSQPSQPGYQPAVTPPQEAAGRLVIAIADKANMSRVSSIMVTISGVEVHSNGSGWIRMSSTPKTFDLMELKASGLPALLAEANLSNGTYDEVRLELSGVTVTDDTGNHSAKLPSGELRINEQFDVNENSTSAISLDFSADNSLHETGDGKYVLAPVVHVQAMENASVDTSNEKAVSMEGSVSVDTQVGMDENGTVRSGGGIPGNSSVSIDDSGRIHVEDSQSSDASRGSSDSSPSPDRSGSSVDSNSSRDSSTGSSDSGSSSGDGSGVGSSDGASYGS